MSWENWRPNQYFPELSFDEFVDVDNNLQICEQLQETILPEVEKDFDEIVDRDNPDEELPNETIKVERCEVMSLIEICKKYAVQNSSEKYTHELLKCTNNLEKCIFSEPSYNVQSLILSYLKWSFKFDWYYYLWPFIIMSLNDVKF